MKLNKLALAVALASSSTAVFALPAFVGGVANTPDVTVNISGASAQQNTLEDLVSDQCVAGTLDIYYAETAAGSNFRSYYCQMGTGTAVPANLQNKKVLVNLRSKGGSIWGVTPVAKGYYTEQLNIFYSSAAPAGSYGDNCTSSTSTATGNAIQLCSISGAQSTDVVSGECPKTGTLSSPTRATQCVVPHGGVSDVEPNMFTYTVNIPAGVMEAPSAADLTNIDVLRQYAVVMGVALDTTTANNVKALGGNRVVNYTSKDGKHVQSYANFSKEELASLMKSGGFTRFGNIVSSLGTAQRKLCVRTAGSGTAAAANIFFLNSPCGASTSTALGLAAEDGVNVIYNGSTGNVKSCINSGYTNGTPSLGIMSLENNPSASDNWEFVAIDGVAPTVGNAETGAYKHLFEQTMQWRKASAGGPATGSMELNTLTMIRNLSGDSNTLAKLKVAGNGVVPSNLKFPGVAALYDSATQNNWEIHHPATRVTRGGNSCATLSPRADSPSVVNIPGNY